MSGPVARIINPRGVPVVGTDDHLPPVAAERLLPQALRERFAGPLGAPEIPGDTRRIVDRLPSAASVLIPIVTHEGDLTVLLTQRTDHLRDHAGQVSFPGGRAELYDVDPAATALREAHEEVGLDPAHVEVIGALPDYTTVTNFVVTPVVALVRPGFVLTLDAFEVADAFEVPLAFLMNPAHHRRHAAEVDGIARQFFSMPFPGTGIAGVAREFFIWGATAAMIRNLYHALST